ncbi:DUF4179 domain-containing protein [Paenibacillus sp. KQZ6P-2]|uniref:DUF4179 domain-containing protein n=1 Tax=Paenibacillus mangrovi TaxID=2931978 RepID=A0A9X2B211_9BACL|nr:DUF4179 domain-containing protein [Paenibacillus mangrovi]MCJ8011445.1 DUF4179 domain-containing protein [Paenibacillus mangrovi]
MSRFYDNGDGVQEKIQAPPRPDYDQMWNNIEQEVSRRKMASAEAKPSSRSRRKYIPAAIVFSCFMVVAVPVFAGVTLNWDSLYGGRSVTNALNNGIGQRYDLNVSSKGVNMSLKGVVTDGEKMKLLVSLDAGMKPDEYDAVELEHMVIKDERGKEEPVNGYLKYDEASGKLLGIYETKDILQRSQKTFTLEADSLVYYKNKDVLLSKGPKAGDSLSTGEARYPEIRIQSLTETKTGLAVRYTVSAADANDQGRGDPHLIVKSGSGSSRGTLTQLPPEDTGILIEQVFGNMTTKDWNAAELEFNYMKETKRIEGSWTFHFHADGKKASEAIYSQPLQTSDEFKKKSGVLIDQLTITPLEIIVSIKDGTPMSDRMAEGEVYYNNVRLVVGDREITGWYTIKGDDPKKYKHMYAFESPEWYKDWSKVPMKLILKDAYVTKRDTSTNWLTLNTPSGSKQSADLKLESYVVHFTYYMDGKDLVVESDSESKEFKGISQTTLRVDGKTIYPRISPRGPNAPSKNIERYPDFKMNHTLELNPGFYSYYDSSRDVEITLH